MISKVVSLRQQQQKITTEQRVREKESSKSNNGYGLIDIKFVE